MSRYEYKVVPAPRKGLKARGVKTSEARFAHALATLMNEEARSGWEYQRADTLPMDTRKGLMGSRTSEQTVLVFRRAVDSHVKSGVEDIDMTEPSTTTPAPKLVLESREGAAPSLGPAAPPGASADQRGV